GGVFIRCGDEDLNRCRLNIDASERFIDTYLQASGRYISGFACKHLLASLYSEDLQAFNYYSSRMERHTLSGKFKAIKLYGDCLARLGLFPLGGRLLRTAREGLRR
ncbi:glycosyltransferase family 2 protein, partial [Serratia ureilytica]